MQGQGGATRFKELRFTLILAQSLRISKSPKVAHYAYYHVDLNAGGGYNTEVDVAGSPLNFLDAAARNQRPNFYAFFIDRDPACIEALIERPEILRADASLISIHLGDNSELLPTVAQFIAARERPRYAMGSVLIDPNGYHSGVPWAALRTFCKAHPCMDVVMNLNVRTYQMARPHIITGTWKGRELHPISSFPSVFSRPHCMVTEVCQIKGDRFIQFVGRSMRTSSPDYRSIGFYDLASERGQRIVAEIEKSDPPASSQLALLPVV